VLGLLSEQPRHGYELKKRLSEILGPLWGISFGSLYPALHRLEKQKWVKSEWRISENKQRAKFYQLTAAGKKQLSRERSKWSQLSDAIAGVLQPEE